MTRILAGDSGLAEAAELLRGGELVAFGTETVYGLGADARDARAVAAVFEAKGRPRFNPLICHYADTAAAFQDVRSNTLADRLARAFWPGPLTLVLPRRTNCSVALLAGAGLDTLAVRVPAAPLARALIARVGHPVAAPSANRSGEVSPTTCTHVWASLSGRIAAILDTGECAVGIESTVLDLSGKSPILLRPGGLEVEAIEAVAGPVGRPVTSGQPLTSELRSPGLLTSHYAPSLPVRLNATTVSADEALLAFGPPTTRSKIVYQLSSRADLIEAAARLFSGLRQLDAEGAAEGLRTIAVMPIPEQGLGLAINDRLARAAAPRLWKATSRAGGG